MPFPKIYKGVENGMYRHGMVGTRFYIIWKAIISRCNYKKNNRYFLYGGKGIKILRKNFIEFRNDMYKSYQEHIDRFGEKDTSIDRIDNNGNYCKENCRWATNKTQANNRKNNIIIEINGVIKNVIQRSKIYGISHHTIYSRLRYGFDPIDAVTLPILHIKK